MATNLVYIVADVLSTLALMDIARSGWSTKSRLHNSKRKGMAWPAWGVAAAYVSTSEYNSQSQNSQDTLREPELGMRVLANIDPASEQDKGSYSIRSRSLLVSAVQRLSLPILSS